MEKKYKIRSIEYKETNLIVISLVNTKAPEDTISFGVGGDKTLTDELIQKKIEEIIQRRPATDIKTQELQIWKDKEYDIK